jgi:hypothetical protein
VGSQTARPRDGWCGSQDANESFSGWTKTFTDPRLCAAIVDRLTFGGNIIEIGITPTAWLTPASSSQHSRVGR